MIRPTLRRSPASSIILAGWMALFALSGCGGVVDAVPPELDSDPYQGQRAHPEPEPEAEPAPETEPAPEAEPVPETEVEVPPGPGGLQACGSSCNGGPFHLELSYNEEIYTFELPPRAGALPGICDEYDVVSAYQGGSCLPTRIAGCAENGQCLVVGWRELSWTDATGASLLQIQIADRSVHAIEAAYGTPGSPLSGTFQFKTEDERLVTGSFSACVVGADYCLR